MFQFLGGIADSDIDKIVSELQKRKYIKIEANKVVYLQRVKACYQAQSQIGDLNSMMKQFDVIIEKDSEGYFVASVPALKGCHTQAKSLDVLMERIREAIELCLEVQDEMFEPLDFVGVQRISVAA